MFLLLQKDYEEVKYDVNNFSSLFCFSGEVGFSDFSHVLRILVFMRVCTSQLQYYQPSLHQLIWHLFVPILQEFLFLFIKVGFALILFPSSLLTIFKGTNFCFLSLASYKISFFTHRSIHQDCNLVTIILLFLETMSINSHHRALNNF